jgi:hypothetical protein
MPKLFGQRSKSMPARCPFCRKGIPRPRQLPGQEFDAGFCPCGAVFAHDPTARNGGAVFLQALVLAADGDMDLAMSLAPGEDYDDAWVEKYDGRTHEVTTIAFGTLYFVRRRTGKDSQV